MEISAHHNANGSYELDIGPVQLTLNHEAVVALHHVMVKRLEEGFDDEKAMVAKKLTAYRALATKMGLVDDQVLQKFVVQIKAEQLVTLVRLADGKVLYNKVLRNLSKQNRRQFEEDFQAITKITEHQAIIYMEQIVPILKKAAQEQKQRQIESASVLR